MNSRVKDLTGKKFSRLIIVEFSHSKNRSSYWKCKCDCGVEKIIKGQSISSGHIKSCGCLRIERKIKHGLGKHSLYFRWKDMKSRCFNSNDTAYEYYGGRGISICDEWADDCVSFINWALKNGYKKGVEIDRIDNDKNYTPKNCRFVTRRKNILNARQIKSNNTSGYRGVSFDKSSSKWATSIMVDKKNKYIGKFKNIKDAIIARNQFIIENDLEHEYQIQDFKE